jgi:Tfp pilus assembly protein PilF
MMKYLVFIAFLLFVFCDLSNEEVLAQSNSIRGKVSNSAGQNLPRITVDLQTGNGTPINQTVTNNEGDFAFSGLSDTSYIIVISTPDHHPVSERIEFYRAGDPNIPGETRTVEISLVPKSADSTGASPSARRPAFVQNIPAPARDSFDRGMKLAKEGKSSESIAALQEATKTFSDYFDAHFALANELIKLDRLSEAIAELEHARRINSKDDRVYQSFSVVLVKQKKYAVAAAVLGEAAKLNPNDPQILVMRGSALIDHAQTIDPSKSKETAAERNNVFAMAENDLMKAYEMSGKKLASVHLQMARLYEKKGEPTRAADELESYLKLSPDAKNADAIREAIKKLRSANRDK